MVPVVAKMMALALAMVMVLAMSMTVFAAGEGSITITDQKKDMNNNVTYDAYLMLNFVPATDGDGEYITDENNKYTGGTYTIATDWAGFFAAAGTGTPAGPGNAYIVDENNAAKNLASVKIGDDYKYLNITESNVAAFAKAAFKWSQENNVAATASNTTGEFTGLNLGYYMIYPRGASYDVDPYTSIVSLTTTQPDAEIVQKAEYPKLEKTDDDASVELGQTVNYVIEGKVPDTTGFTTEKPYDYVISDTLSTGLTLDRSTVKVYIDGTEISENWAADYSLMNAENKGGTFKVDIDVMKLQASVGKKIEVKYSVTVNSNAVTHVEKNKASLTYTRDPKTPTDKTKTPDDEETVFSSKIVIDKYDANNTSVKLEGATFVLKCKTAGTVTTTTYTPDDAGTYYKLADGTYTTTAPDGTNDEEYASTTQKYKAETSESGEKATAVANKFYKVVDGKVTWVDNQDDADTFVTNENGAVDIPGLENATYELIETVSPAGYNLLTEPVEVTIAGTDADPQTLSVTATVENNQGSVLPSTGGIGTTIFYVVGAILVIGAGVILITRRRMDA